MARHISRTWVQDPRLGSRFDPESRVHSNLIDHGSNHRFPFAHCRNAIEKFFCYESIRILASFFLKFARDDEGKFFRDIKYPFSIISSSNLI